MDARDESHLRATIALAREARTEGNHPFGARLVCADGAVVDARNSVVVGRDPIGHAETNVVREACLRLGPDAVVGATAYASTEPCAMCAGALYWAGVARVVFGLSEDDLRVLTGAHPENPTLALPCREVFARGRGRSGQKPVLVEGPVLVDEARAVHDGFWR